MDRGGAALLAALVGLSVVIVAVAVYLGWVIVNAL
jgi:hypothetical protein